MEEVALTGRPIPLHGNSQTLLLSKNPFCVSEATSRGAHQEWQKTQAAIHERPAAISRSNVVQNHFPLNERFSKAALVPIEQTLGFAPYMPLLWGT